MYRIEIEFIYIYAEAEHLGSFGILNMNGRIFDPNTATFFSPDPFVVDPSSTQAFNRYSYCLNNPLMYTDPTGEFFLSAILFGAAINWVSSGFFTNSNGKLDWKANWNMKGLKAAAVGGLAGGVAAGVSAAALGGNFFAGATSSISKAALTSMTANATMSTAVLSGVASGAAAGFITGTGNSLLKGESLGNSLLSGLKGAGIGGSIGGLTSYMESMQYFTKKGHISSKIDPNKHWSDKLLPDYFAVNNPQLVDGGGDYFGFIEGFTYNSVASRTHDLDFINMGIDRGGWAYALSTKPLGADWALAIRQSSSAIRHMDIGGLFLGIGTTGVAAGKSIYGNITNIIYEIFIRK